MKILLVDDHKIIRRVLGNFLRDELDAEVIEGNNGVEGLNFFKANDDFEVVLADINMPKMDGIEMVKEIRQLDADIKIIALSMMDDSSTIKKMIAAGASSYVLKEGDTNELLKAIEMVMNGETYYSPSVTETIMTSFTKQRANSISTIEASLSDREKEVLRLIIEEYTNHEIAEKLFISVRTVEAHKRNLLDKTHAKNVAGLLKYALKHQLFDDLDF
jgi:DNA-binding NarL/FixJ family response regulator